ncbi:1-phosphatidylinositol phosphodiesterase-like [Hydra vulgaris]|uniref:1-phosphatidylinositol phosphodiesterase-like n=1 Tax=Hydra vulgaris TaxID=6087 RepID=A0ABM4DJ09_HYDVU
MKSIAAIAFFFNFHVLSADPWMSRLSDNIHIGSITIPGTHDSAAYSTSLIWAKTQDWSILDQLKNGIRFLDIRCRHISNIFTIHHGAIYLNMNFDDVMNSVIQFLNQNPTETVLMRIKEEHDPDGNTRSFAATFNEYYNKYNSYFWNGPTDDPTLKETRKKIVVLENFLGNGIRFGLPYNSFDIQDQYETNDYTVFSLDNYNDKKRSVKDQVEKAKFRYKIINYLSAVGKGALISVATPKAISTVINPFLKSLIYQNKFQYFGIVVADYPDIDLINLIIERNPPTSIYNGQVLTSENYLQSSSGRYRAIFSNPGEFYVLDVQQNARIWQSLNNRESKMWAVKMQDDGNLVMYNDYWKFFRQQQDPYWASDTFYCFNGIYKYELIMQDDGNLVIYSYGANMAVRPIWSSMSKPDNQIWRTTNSKKNCPR